MSSPSFHPQEIALTEDTPASVDSYRIIAKSETEVVLADGTYPSDPSGVTTIPIGDNGFFNNIVSGTSVKLYVQELLGGESSVPQFINTYIVLARPNGPENVVVNY